MTMIVVNQYTPCVVFDAMDEKPCILPDGVPFKGSSDRLVLFRRSTVCVSCNLMGVVFNLETHDPQVKPHLNLYAVLPGGKHVLMTKDHIVPKSRGGANSQDNYQVMCSPCNRKKADTI